MVMVKNVRNFTQRVIAKIGYVFIGEVRVLENQPPE